MAEIYTRLGLLERAVPVLEKAVASCPQHEGSGWRWPTAWPSCGRYDEARAAAVAPGRAGRLAADAEARPAAPASRRDRAGPGRHRARARPSSSRRRRWTPPTPRSARSSPRWRRPRARSSAPSAPTGRCWCRRATKRRRIPRAVPVLALTEILLRLLRPRAQARTRRRGGRAARLGPGGRHQGPGAGPRPAARSAGDGRPRGARPPVREAARARGRHAGGGGDLRRDGGEPARAGRAPRPPSTRSCGRWRPRPEIAQPPRAAHRAGTRGGQAASARRSAAGAGRAAPPQGRRRASRATLLLLAADIAERDFGDQTRALDLHRRAEEMQPRSFEVLSGIARLALQRGERGRMRPGGRRCSSSPPPRRATPTAAAEALYRAAGARAADARRRATPASPICAEAIEKSGDLERAAALVEAAGVPDAELVKILPLYERIARQSGDDAVLFDYLERRVATPDVTVARGARGGRPGRRAAPRGAHGAAAASGWRTSAAEPRRRARGRHLGAVRAAPDQEGGRRSRRRGAHPAGARRSCCRSERVVAAGARSRRAGRPLRQPAAGRRAARAPARHARPPTSRSGGRCSTTTSACATARV